MSSIHPEWRSAVETYNTNAVAFAQRKRNIVE
jgi:hypothetical protein